MNRLLPLFLLTACGDDGTDTPATDSGTETAEVIEPSGPYLGEDDDQDPPGFDADGVAGVLESAVAGLLQLNGAPVVQAYTRLAAGESDGCPLWVTGDDVDYWYDSCTSDDGTTFDGYGYIYEYDGWESDGNTWWGDQVYGVFTLTGPDGETLSGAGGASLLRGYGSTGEELTYSLVQSGFAYTGDGAEGTWLAAGIDPALTYYAAHYPEVDGRVVVVSGAVEVGSNGVDAVVIDDLMLADEGLGTPCPEEPSGTVSVLDTEGRWYDLVFDGPTWDDWGAELPDCDGCATAWYGGERLGEACVDFTALVDWDTSPAE